MEQSLLRIGTRGSELALTQTRWVQERLRELGRESEIIVVRTLGDRVINVPLARIGSTGVFVKELEQLLLQGDIDLAVHSLKDVETSIPEGLTIAAIPEREDPRDALCSRTGGTLDDLPGRARVATSSSRRRAQLLSTRPDLQIQSVRGNIDTRLRKLAEGEFDGLIMAVAGLIRMGWQDKISQYLPADMYMPAPGQGALAVECRADEPGLLALLKGIEHVPSRAAVAAERAFLSALGGGCLIPVGALATVQDDVIILRGMVAAADGRRIIREKECGSIETGYDIANRLADKMRSLGAEEILASFTNEEETLKNA